MKMRLTTKIGSLVALFGLLLLACCAGAASGSDHGKGSGFYGSVTGGGLP